MNDKRSPARCVDCGSFVRFDTKRCRKCYVENVMSRGAVSQRLKDGRRCVVDQEEQAFTRMDAKFCAAMRRAIEAGLERP